MLQEIDAIVTNFLQELRKKYGVATCDLRIEPSANKYSIKGKILSHKQQHSLATMLYAFADHIKWEVEILEDAYPPLGWSYVEQTPVNIWNRTLVEDHLKFLTSQIIVKDEPLKLLWETSDFFCIQQMDKTIGWVRKHFIQKYPTMPAWQPPIQKATNQREFLAYINRWLGVPYLRGGLTTQGVDCSGLVQNVYRHQFQYLLPRHSMDQMKVGTQIDNPQLGDLAFFEFHHPGSDSVTSHVGIVIDPDTNTIVHASLEMEKKVVSNSLVEMTQKGYRFLGYRRYQVEIL